MAQRLAFAADALVRFKQGRILIHTTSSPLPAFESVSPMLIGWLCQFSKPTFPEDAIAALPRPDREAVASVVDYLKRSGVLVENDTRPEPIPDEAELLARTKNHLQLLARSLYDTACDILSFGSHAERELDQRTGTGVERRLIAMVAATDGLRSELAALRPTYVEQQLQALAITSSTQGLRLHIGCGGNHLDGWINIDVYPAPLALNVLSGLPFADGTVRYVFVSHLLEHLFYPRDVKPFLAETLRVLEPGGIVRIVVPDVEQCIEAYVTNDRNFFSNRRETWPWWPENPTRLEDFLAYAGAGAEPAYLFESHKYGYDFETLSRVLVDAGFDRVTRSGFMASHHEALQVDYASAVAKATYGDRHYSLFVEAQRRVE
jgi:SAM-dependent methyltransferase